MPGPSPGFEERRTKHHHAEHETRGHLQFPGREIADRLSRQVFQRALILVDQPPIAADGAFEPALPGLVIGLDQVDAKPLALRQIEDFRHHTRLVGARGQRPFAHPAGARPAGLADQDLLARERHRHPLADVVDMRGGVFGLDRDVLPIRQDMNGDEIDRVIDLAVAQPELPDVGIGHRNLWPHLRLDRTDQRGEIGRGHLPAQQHFVADHHRRDHTRIGLHQAHGGLDLQPVLGLVGSEPDALDHLQSDLAGQLRNLIDPVVDLSLIHI